MPASRAVSVFSNTLEQNTMNSNAIFKMIALPVAFLASSAWASNWVLIDGGPDSESSTSIDMDSIKVKGGLVHFSEKLDYKVPQAAGGGATYKYMVLEIVANCQDMSLAMTSGKAYGNDGFVVDSTTVPDTEWKFDQPKPGTAGVKELALACRKMDRQQDGR
jgi:hypothetical protein